MKSKNLELWDSLATTDPKYVKEFNRGGFKGSAINPTYIARRLTETFGPCGQGWRFVVEDEKYACGHSLGEGEIFLSNYMVHVIRGHLDYKVGDEWYSTGPQYGQTTFVGKNKNGLFTDEEAPKKSITDALSKCAALIGVSADIYLGLYDANKYVNDPAKEKPTKKRSSASTTPRKTGKRSASTKSAPSASDGDSASTDAGSASVPPDIASMEPEQLGEFFELVGTPSLLVESFDQTRSLSWWHEDEAVKKLLCEHVSDAARRICQRGSEDWDAIIAALTEEKRFLDEGPPAPKKKTRKRKAATKK